MMRPSVPCVNCTVCCVSDAAVTYARDSLLILRRAFCPLEGGGGGGGGGVDILAPGLHLK